MDWNENVTLTNDSATSVKRWLHALNFFQDKYLLKMFPNIQMEVDLENNFEYQNIFSSR